jgi:peptide deformylase
MDFDTRITAAEIIKIGHPALRSGTRKVSEELFGSPALYELIAVMRATLAGQGVGLAAPQIAVPLRMFVIEDTEERMSHLSAEQRRDRHRYPYPFEAIINPVWRATSTRIAIEQEGCLSIPGLTADVPRYWAIEAEGQNPEGEPKRWSLEGWPARIFQHESDHLDGLLMTDRMVSRTLAFAAPHGHGASPDLLERLGLAGL